MDHDAQTYFDHLREQHFPSERNFLAAHLTLFHALPENELEQIQVTVADLAQRQSNVVGESVGVRSLGRGVAFDVSCPLLVAARHSWLHNWYNFLTPQDRQGWRPHITVQNKVTREEATDLLQHLKRDFKPKPIRFPGLDLWLYGGGPWELVQSFPFLGEPDTSQLK